MKISQVYTNGSMASQSLFGEKFEAINWKKLLRNPENPKKGISFILRLNPNDLMALSERVRIGDYVCKDLEPLEFNPDLWIFEPDPKVKEFTNPAIFKTVEINFNQISWIVRLAIFPSSKESTAMINPDSEKYDPYWYNSADFVIDWKILYKISNQP
jgi:hypothetical protein